MTEVEISKLVIASEYLDAAIGFFWRGRTISAPSICRQRRRNCLARIFPKINASLRWPGKLRRR